MKVILVGPSASALGGISACISLLHQGLEDEGLSVYRLKTTNCLYVFNDYLVFCRAFFSLFFRMVFSRPDIIHIHMASRGSFIRKSILCLLSFLFRVPYIIHLHGGGFKDFYKDLPVILKTYLRFIFRNASSVITLSEVWNCWVRSQLGVINSSSVANGVPDYEVVARDKKRQPVVLFMGLLSQNKGTDILISAFDKVVKNVPEAALELCGNGDVEYYRALAKGAPNIRFLGWVSPEERLEALKRATVFCLPSWKEGLPLSILEAMSAGLPVISTRVGSIPELIEDGVHGYLIEPGDVDALSQYILKIINNSDLALSMGQAGKSLQRSKYSTLSMVDGCLHVYKSSLVGRDA